MCAPRKEGEPWIFYAARLIEEKARVALTIACLLSVVALTYAIVGLYHDQRELTREIIKSYQIVGAQLQEMNVRIQDLEMEHKRAGIKK